MEILVTGATGNLGNATIKALLNKGVDKNSIGALVRDESKADELKELGVTIVKGDYNDYDSLVNAFKGVNKLFFISSSEVETRQEQHMTVVKAAKEAAVNYILYTSIQRKTDKKDSPLDFVLDSHMATEEAIKETGITYTFMRNNLYLDFLPWFLGDKVLETGVYLPADEGKVGFMLRAEMGEIAANLLTTDGHDNKAYNISGTEAVSFGEVAAMLTEITGKEIAYVSPTYDEFMETMDNAGVPKLFAIMFGGFAQGAAQGELESGNTVAERLLGRKPTTVKDFVKQVYAQK